MNYDKNDIHSIERYAQEIEGISLKESGVEHEELDVKNKGQLGQLIEKHYFGYAPNSRKEADFFEAGLELKVAPVKRIKEKPKDKMYIKRKGLSVKERIVVSIINYFEISEETWENASIKKKMKMLLMFYIYEKDVKISDYVFYLASIWEPSEEDLQVIKNDWEMIKAKVMQGKAHEISEGDTMYLGACTKGANSQSMRSQPKSNELAMQRAFSLKRSYVDFILEELLQKRKNKASKKLEEGLSFSLDTKIDGLSGKTMESLKEEFGIERARKAKNYIQLFTYDLLEKMFNVKAKDIQLLKKAEIEIKCVLLQPNAIPRESMSFEQIQYKEIINENWEESILREKFENKKHLWIVYRASRNYKRQSDLQLDEIILDCAFFWNMPLNDLNGEFYRLWEDTRDKIMNDDFENFMKSSDNRVGHIRPKGQNNKDLMMTANGSLERKKCFWLNAKYVAEVIKEEKNKNKCSNIL